MKLCYLILAFLCPAAVIAQGYSTVSCVNGETGTCRQATTCSQANVQAAITASSAGTDGYISPTSFHGDGIYVPAGSCSWSSAVSWTDKNINLIAGVGGTTTITHTSSDAIDVSVTGAAGSGPSTAAAFRVSGFATTGSTSGDFFNINSSNPNMTTWAGYYRLDHNTLNYSSSGNVLIWYGPVYGVIDHNTITSSNTNLIEQDMFLNSEYPGPPTTSLLTGETVGRTFAAGMGTQNLVYVENNTFDCGGSYGSGALSDSEGGPQRLVMRYNTVTGSCYMYAHWTRYAEWDGGVLEIYKNNFDCTDASCPGSGGYLARFEAGTGVIHDNTVNGYPVTSIQIDETRGSGATGGSSTGTPTNTCDGTQVFDVNAGDTNAPGWPCAGQVGTACISGSCTRSTMNSVPIIAWNNGTQAGCSTGGSCTNSITFNVDGPGGGGTPTRTMANYLKSTAHSLSGAYNGAIDYFSGSSQPSSVGIYTGIASYIPFTYPYPTTTSGTSYTFTLTKIGTGTIGGTNCTTGSYTSGTTITCTAAYSSGWVFTGWSGACSGMGTCALTLTSNMAVTANFVATTGQFLNIETSTAATTANLSNPGWNINNQPADTGGVNSPASQSQTNGNASPAGGCTGTSQKDTLTTIATSTQTNVLFWYYGTGDDSATNFVEEVCIYVSNIAAANNIEIDFDQYNVTQGKLHSFGHQYNIATGCWQYASNSSGWQTTTACPSFAGNTWHDIIWTGHQDSGHNYYDELTQDGVSYNINANLASEAIGALPTALISQVQIDAGPTSGSAATVSYNVDNFNFSAYGLSATGAPQLMLLGPL